MPIDYSDYPENWQEIRKKVLRRAGGLESDPRVGARCEKCGIRNYAVGYRDKNGCFHGLGGSIYYDDYQYATSYSEARKIADEMNAFYEFTENADHYIVIVLTVAHMNDPNPANVDLDNLSALCQRCHNKHDIGLRRTNAAKTRRKKKIEQGQLQLWHGEKKKEGNKKEDAF
jgi:5-methylcytosine-specific restriction endonuclease McrA